MFFDHLLLLLGVQMLSLSSTPRVVLTQQPPSPPLCWHAYPQWTSTPRLKAVIVVCSLRTNHRKF